MLISARKETYKWRIWENILRKRKNETQETDTNKKTSGRETGEREDTEKRREGKLREILVTIEGRQEE